MAEQTQKLWTADEDATLTAQWRAGEPHSAIAARLGRSVRATAARALRLGLRRQKHVALKKWAAWEDDLLRIAYPDLGGVPLAAHFGCPLKAVWRRASSLKLRCEPDLSTDEVRDRVRALHAEGRSNSAIAAAMADVFRGRDPREQVTNLLQRMGLRANPDPDSVGRTRAALRAKYGVENPGKLRIVQRGGLAARYGLPEDLYPHQVAILLLLVGGPRSNEQILTQLGIRHNSVRRADGKRSSLTGDLVRRGLIAHVPGPDRSAGVYMLTGAALAALASAPAGPAAEAA